MKNPLIKPEALANDAIIALEKEITELEKELERSENEINVFTAQIRNQLHFQILRIRQLTELYKAQKTAKKTKRLEQKRKGKNYREPQAIKKIGAAKTSPTVIHPDSQLELKRLYKEAIRHVHPDKFASENEAQTERATAVTMQLNNLYQNGDLAELKGFHEHIISGNAMAHLPYQAETIANAGALLIYLQKKRSELINAITEVKQSELFQVLYNYADPLTFIPELEMQFNQKIAQLEKRTRQKKN